MVELPITFFTFSTLLVTGLVTLLILAILFVIALKKQIRGISGIFTTILTPFTILYYFVYRISFRWITIILSLPKKENKGLNT